MIVDIATEERIPVNEIKDLPLGKLGLLICNESLKDNNEYVDELLKEFIETCRLELQKQIPGLEIYRQVLATDPSGKNSIPRLIIHTKADTISDVKTLLNHLREYFQIQGGLRLPVMGTTYKTDNGDFKYFHTDEQDFNIILDFMEYKCTELYKELGYKKSQG